MTDMYLLTLTGIYDHGALGIFTDPKDAEDYARKLYETSDGYHRFRLEKVKLDTKMDPEVDLNVSSLNFKAPFEEIFNKEV